MFFASTASFMRHFKAENELFFPQQASIKLTIKQHVAQSHPDFPRRCHEAWPLFFCLAQGVHKGWRRRFMRMGFKKTGRMALAACLRSGQIALSIGPHRGRGTNFFTA